MSHTYTSLQYHLVFSTKDRRPLLSKELMGRVHTYTGGIVRNMQGEPICIGGTEDHVHALFSLKPNCCISDAACTIKANSSKWIHETFPTLPFGWQEGYGAFTVSRIKVGAMAAYIQNQEEHHRKSSFQEEFLSLLQRHGIAYEERYLWV
jgi:REP element-mobilizing transposase RayT